MKVDRIQGTSFQSKQRFLPQKTNAAIKQILLNMDEESIIISKEKAHMLKSLDNWSSKLILDQKAFNSKAANVESNAIKKKRYSHAIDEFNSDPEHNLKELISSGLVKEDPHEIALFLHSL